MGKRSNKWKNFKNILQKYCHKLKELTIKNVKEYQKKANWGSLATMLTGIVALDTFREIGSAIAKYQGRELIYTLSFIFTIIIATAAIWEFLCLIHVDRLGSAVCRCGGKLWKWFKTRSPKWKLGSFVGILVVAITIVLCWKFFYYDKCTTECFASIVEIYGIPRGVGNPLSQEEKNQQSGYWQIDEYSNQHRIILTYVESYQQLEIMRQYSTVYNMQIFQTPARIEYTYAVNADKFYSYGQNSFLTAKENGYREPLTISYYGSNGKLLLQLNKEEEDAFMVERYSSEEQPQLLNSTLLRIPDGKEAGNGLASQHIETTYNADGLPEMRRLAQGTCNLYGVNGERYTYDYNNRMTSLCYLDGDGMPVCNKIGVMLITFKYDDERNQISVRYYSNENGTEKTEGFYGVFCEKLFYDSFYNLTERRQLDRTENWSCDNNGVYQYKYKYKYEPTYFGKTLQEESYWGLNETSAWNKQCSSHSLSFETGIDDGRKILSISFISAGMPSKTSSLHGITDISLKPNMFVGNRTFQTDFDVQEGASGSIFNRPVDLDSGVEESDNKLTEMEDMTQSGRKYTSIQYIFDNNSLEKKYCDAQGNPVINEYGYAMKRTEFDDKMRVILESYADESGTLCYINGGYAAIRHIYKNDTEDRIECLQYLDIKGDVTFNTKVGYAWVKYEYTPQDKGEKITRFYYDANDKPCYILDKGYASVEDLYNENGFLIQRLYKNTEDTVTCRHDYMVAEILYEYADDGNLIRERYKDAQGQPVNRADTGYAVIYQEFEAGRLSRKFYEGYKDKTLCAVPDRTTGIASITYHYERGKKVENYFDTEGKPALRKDIGCASIEYKYNDNGQLNEEYYYGTDGELTLRKDTGCAIARFGYDNVGRRNSWRYYGVKEEAVINTKYHCAGIDYVYEERGYRAEIRYIGLDGALMNRDDYGIAVICKKYDDFGNLSGESYYDEKESRAIRKDYGYASYEDVYEKGHLKERRYLDTQGNLMLCKNGRYAVLLYGYDDYGQCNAFCYLGEDRKPIINSKSHCAKIEQQYDERGHIIRISYKGLNDTLINRTDYGVAEIRREYDEFGNIVKEFYYSADGLPAIRKEYGYASYQNFYEDGRLVESRYFDAGGSLVLRKDTGYAVIKIAYDKYGQTLTEYYYGMTEKLIIHTDYHCAGIEYNYDQMGNRTEIQYIGLDGLLMNCRDSGIAKICREYDTLGNLTNKQYFDTEGNPTVRREYDYASFENIYENRLLIETRYFDTEGNLVLRNDVGYAVIKMEYDQNGRETAEYYYDAFGKPVVSIKYHCAGMTYTYDSKGNQEKISYLGLDGEVSNRDDYGCATIYQEYDDWGYLTGKSYFDADGNPTIRKEYGYASYHSTYKNGTIVESRYFDTSGDLIPREDYGYAITKSNYDEYGREISWLFYDENEKPVISTKYHCAGFEYVYDEKSNNVEIRYIGLDGELMKRCDYGFARVCKTYDSFGNLTGETYYDEYGYSAVWKKYGYASYQNTYENGKWIESRYFDLDGDLILRKDTGYALIQLEYDQFGQQILEHYYGIDEQPVLHSQFHCAGIGHVYDEKGNQIETYYLGLDDELINRNDYGIAKVCMEYDSMGHLVSKFYFDVEQQSIVRKDEGYASYRNIYENGKLAEIRYYDAAGHLTLRKETGVAIIKYQYDEFRRNKAFLYFGIDEEPIINSKYYCAGMEYTYDEKGNLIKILYIQADGSPMNREDYGIAQIQQEYDIYGNLVKESYCDTEGNLSLKKNCGYAVCQKEYENGKIKEIRYFDANGNLVLRKDTGYARVHYDYNELGQEIYEWYYDTDNKRTISLENHCAGLYYGYDDRGNQTETWYMGKSGQVTTREDLGVNLKYQIYDEYDSLLWEAYYTFSDEEYHLVVPKGYDYAGKEYYYDENENWIRQRYFDAEKKTVMCSEKGYAVYERKYNNIGQLIAVVYYDEKEEFVNGVNGYAMIEYIYDASGNNVDWKYYDQSEVQERLDSMQ